MPGFELAVGDGGAAGKQEHAREWPAGYKKGEWF
jgi:hypothetical protein